MIAKILKDFFTERDNETFDIYRVLVFLACINFFALCTLETFKGHDFQPIEYGTGFGLLLTGVAGGFALKKNSESEKKESK